MISGSASANLSRLRWRARNQMGTDWLSNCNDRLLNGLTTVFVFQMNSTRKKHFVGKLIKFRISNLLEGNRERDATHLHESIFTRHGNKKCSHRTMSFWRCEPPSQVLQRQEIVLS